MVRNAKPAMIRMAKVITRDNQDGTPLRTSQLSNGATERANTKARRKGLMISAARCSPRAIMKKAAPPSRNHTIGKASNLMFMLIRSLQQKCFSTPFSLKNIDLVGPT